MITTELDSARGDLQILLRSFLKGTLKEMMSCLTAECGSLFLFDVSSEELVLDSFYNSRPLAVRGVRKKKGEGVTGRMIAVRKPVLVRDISQDARFCTNGFTHYRSGSFLSIPLFCKEEFIGLINLADKGGASSFTEQDLAFAVALGRYAGRIMEQQAAFLTLRRQNQALVHQKSLLERYASVGRLASGIVHEISNPLDGVIRFTNILARFVEQGSAEEYVREIKKGLLRIQSITTGLLGFGRHFCGRGHPRNELLDLAVLVDEALEYFAPRIAGTVCVQKDYRCPTVIMADRSLLHVFVNLIKNALDAMPAGGSLRIRASRRGQGVCLSFEDSGTGIPLQSQERLFEPFYTTKHTTQGAGLGLAICKEIIDSHAGSIEVSSRPGQGAKFEVILPSGIPR